MNYWGVEGLKSLKVSVVTGLQEHGHDWTAVSNTVGTKSEAECETFFNTYKKKYNLEASLDKNKPKPVSGMFCFMMLCEKRVFGVSDQVR